MLWKSGSAVGSADLPPSTRGARRSASSGTIRPVIRPVTRSQWYPWPAARHAVPRTRKPGMAPGAWEAPPPPPGPLGHGVGAHSAALTPHPFFFGSNPAEFSLSGRDLYDHVSTPRGQPVAHACFGRQRDCAGVPPGACKPQAPPINGASLVVRPIKNLLNLPSSHIRDVQRGTGGGPAAAAATRTPGVALEGPRPSRSRGSRGLDSLVFCQSR